MISRHAFLAVLAAALLAGCAPRATYMPINPVNNEKLKNARVVFERLPSIPLVYRVRPSASADSTAAAQKRARESIEPVLETLQKNSSSLVAQALAQRGIQPGADTTIFLRPVSGDIGDRGALVFLEVTVQHKDASKASWICKIPDSPSVGEDDKAVAAKFSSRVIEELEKAGFIPKL